MNSDYSETTLGTTTKSSAQSEAEEAIADSLSRVVRRWRACVVIMLLITAALVVTTTYLFLRDNEDAQFQKSFEKSANSIKDSVEFHATNAVRTFEALADGITGEAMTANATWPFFTSRGFEVAAAHARLNAFAETVMLMPLVLGKQREEWEAYSMENAGWVDESQKLAAETSKWLMESDFFSPPGAQVEDELKRDTPGRQLETSQRKTITIDVMEAVEAEKAFNETGNGEGKTNEETETMTPATVVTTIPPIPVNTPEISNEIFLKGEDLPGGYDGDTTIISESWRVRYAPVWQISPPPKMPSLINYNFLGDATSGGTFNAIQVSGNKAIVSELLKTSTIDFFYKNLWTTEEHWGFHSSSGVSGQHNRTPGTFPHSTTIAPIRASFDPDAEMVGLVAGIAPWDLYLSRLLPEGTNGVYAVLSNSCAQVVTYIINGPEAIFLGKGDLHDTNYDNLKETLSFTGFGLSTAASRRAGQCDYFLALYASDEYRSEYEDKNAELFAITLAAVFLATGIVFFVFAMYVQRRQQEVMTTALKTNKIVASLFPANVRDRILKDAEEQIEHQNQKLSNANGLSGTSSHGQTDPHTQNLKKYLKDEKEEADRRSLVGSVESEEVNTNIFGSAPIADLFPETTLMFADLVGFTAWSSMREPTQVFTLLETVYHSFDQLANKRRVFKVETVGDCYVAVTGVPEPRKDHAVVMCRFAKDCFDKLKPLLKKLEVVLGPDTGDLSMRFGLHSGPVTAGVLRGERARFQLFGDTMNTCSRIETTGKTGSIHISQQTADLLKASGKENWYVPRKDKVMAKGKGELQTYWLVFKQNDGVSSCSGGSNSRTSFTEFGEGTGDEALDLQEAASTPSGAWPSPATVPQPAGMKSVQNRVLLSKKAERLVDWNVDILSRLLKQIVARRESDGGKTLSGKKLDPVEREMRSHEGEGTILDEVAEIIQLPKYDKEAARRKKEQISPQSIKLPSEVTSQLRTYVSTIASMYRDTVPFHNFEHASHVTMSVVKLLSRIVAPKVMEVEGDFNKELHDHTYGIASDPLTQFAVVLSALMHDVDHVGVPNAQLVKENVAICSLYRGKSVAEQNSVDISWNLLMEGRFNDLRATIYSSKGELIRFRQLVVNTVLATDIVDKELKELRNARWDRAFHQKEQPEEQDIKQNSIFNDDATNRKATIVIEHIIQASDIAHTMQHWHVYRKWNERFFEENMWAYQTGRAANDPSEFWYKGEIGFFDFYIIPLAKKLEECGVFGVSSHEYRQYALANREEWVSKGQQIVEEMKAKYSVIVSQRENLQQDTSLTMKQSSMRSRETFCNEPKSHYKQAGGQNLDSFQNEIAD